MFQPTAQKKSRFPVKGSDGGWYFVYKMILHLIPSHFPLRFPSSSSDTVRMNQSILQAFVKQYNSSVSAIADTAKITRRT